MYRGLITASLPVCAIVGTSGCVSSEYAGISLRPGATSADIQALARRAQAGDKYAQLALGVRYEEGRGVPRDLAKAKILYARAASDSGGTLWVYSPAVGAATKGRVIPVSSGPRRAGLDEAKLRLKHLKGVRNRD
ncbi:SEL1-like repeat protein [Sphingomonas sp. QA11]|uniref:SEL1-like repeat protein n=1 Tax=Sphingomonas sp. QA11 TaxID=2950605 RepID=UPI002349272E|nr:SEL1-like repeat protein [Sphingomonas sp. QA11]WCM25843.1 SEL1-like repeat protein [Sphingomonas sp. QA11]